MGLCELCTVGLVLFLFFFFMFRDLGEVEAILFFFFGSSRFDYHLVVRMYW